MNKNSKNNKNHKQNITEKEIIKGIKEGLESVVEKFKLFNIKNFPDVEKWGLFYLDKDNKWNFEIKDIGTRHEALFDPNFFEKIKDKYKLIIPFHIHPFTPGLVHNKCVLYTYPPSLGDYKMFKMFYDLFGIQYNAVLTARGLILVKTKIGKSSSSFGTTSKLLKYVKKPVGKKPNVKTPSVKKLIVKKPVGKKPVGKKPPVKSIKDMDNIIDDINNKICFFLPNIVNQQTPFEGFYIDKDDKVIEVYLNKAYNYTDENKWLKYYRDKINATNLFKVTYVDFKDMK